MIVHTRHSIQNVINLAKVKGLVPLASRSYADINGKFFVLFFYPKNIGNQKPKAIPFPKVLIKGSKMNGLRAKISAVTLTVFFSYLSISFKLPN